MKDDWSFVELQHTITHLMTDDVSHLLLSLARLVKDMKKRSCSGGEVEGG